MGAFKILTLLDKAFLETVLVMDFKPKTQKSEICWKVSSKSPRKRPKEIGKTREKE